ncbi:MAG: omptin family outer membrane protease [Halanaerobium sp.]
MKKIILYLFILIIILGISTAKISAADNKFEFGIKQLQGETQYRIEGSGWASELIFPLDSKIMGIKYKREDFSIAGRDLIFKYGQTISGDNISGFEDSDWLNGDSAKDIYSKGNVDLDSKTFDLGLRYNNKINKKNKWNLIFGYQRIKHDFDVHSAVNYFGSSGFLINRGHTVLKYETDYSIPYIGGGYTHKFSDDFSISGNLKWSPISEVEDQDDHLLRNKVANSKADGNSYIINLDSNYQINNSWQSYLNASYFYSDLEGSQSQYWYGDDPETEVDDTGTKIRGINYENKQEMITFAFGFKYNF